MEIMAPPGMEEMTNQLQSMFSNMSRQQSKTQKMPVKAAFEASVTRKRQKWSTKKSSSKRP